MKQKILKPLNKILIFADIREADSLLVNELEELGGIVKTKRLDMADFLLSDRVAVERKTKSDFLQSIIDGRLFKQMDSLCKHYEKPVLLIEGKGFYNERGIHPNAIRGALSCISIDYGVPILWSEDQEDSAGLLFTIARREQFEFKRDIAIRSKRKSKNLKEKQEFLVSGLPNVSIILSRRLLKRFKTVKNVFVASETELRKIEGIGKEKAKKIKELLDKRYK